MLNPALYKQLQGLFKDGVRISHEDEPLVFGFRTDHNGIRRKWKEQCGESYSVCCPICGDTRFRLSISYAWGMDEKEGYPTSKLVNCYNERCQDNYEEDREDRGNARLYLERRLRAAYLDRVNDGAVAIAPIMKDRGKKEIVIPFPEAGWSSPVDLLPENHPAVQYLISRNFDPAVVSKEWGVVLANEYPVEANGKRYSWLAGRLFIPVSSTGWQARAIDESKPKYFSCPGWKKSASLYNINRARKFSEFVLICEGVTDTWRVGGPAVAVFGKSLSTQQVMKLRRNWNVVGVLFDPDAETDSVNSTRRAMNQLSQVGMTVFRVSLTGEKDAAMCSYGHLWDCIERSAAAADISCVHRPRSNNG